MRIFEKHGMENIGYWTPTSEEERDDTLVYIIAHDSEEAAAASWSAFIQDPEWAGSRRSLQRQRPDSRRHREHLHGGD